MKYIIFFEVIQMGFASLFQKKNNYFDKQMKPQCGYCQFGRRTKEGNRILCDKIVSLKEETDSCGKFVYSPLKRVPIKQLKNEGFVADEEMYVEIVEKEPEKEPEKKPEAEAPKAEEPAPAVEAAPAEEPAQETPVEEAPAEAVQEAVENTVSAVPGFDNLNELSNAAAEIEAAAAEQTN